MGLLGIAKGCCVRAGNTTIHEEGGSRDKASFIGCKEEHRVCNLFCFTEASHWHMDKAALSLLLGIEVLHEELGAQWSGAECIDADVLTGMNCREFLGHRQNGAL